MVSSSRLKSRLLAGMRMRAKAKPARVLVAISPTVVERAMKVELSRPRARAVFCQMMM